MLFAINSACSSPEFIALEDFDFDFDFYTMSRKSSYSPDSDREDSVPPPPLSTINETLYPTHQHASPYSNERLGAVHSYYSEDRIATRTCPESHSSHLQSSPYNYPVNPESTLITPTSISSQSPSLNSRMLPVRPRSETPVQHYHSQSNFYPATSNPPRTSTHEEHIYSPFHIYENDPIPPPYWGNYNVSPPAVQSPPLRYSAGPVLIAPQPERSLSAGKRPFEEDISYLEPVQQSRKRLSLPRESFPVVRKARHELNREEQYLIYLKEDLKLPWKDIQIRWSHEMGRNKNEAALQMQYKRLRERIRLWTSGDIKALAKAVQEVGSLKWEEISTTMLDFGLREKWTRQACQAKWETLDEHEIELAKENGCPPRSHDDRYDDRYYTPPRSYDDGRSSNASGRSITPDSSRGMSAPGSKLEVSPSQLLVSQHDGLPSLPNYGDRYVSPLDWSAYVTQP